MNYKVLVKQCSAPKAAAVVAEEIAKRAGVEPGTVVSALIERAICIKRSADAAEAMRLKAEFEAIGAELDFVALESPKTPEQEDEGDEAEDLPGRILSEAEFLDQLKSRTDIFAVEKDGRIRKVEAACLMAGIASGIWLTKHDVAAVIPGDFYEKGVKEFTVNVLPPQNRPVIVKPVNPAPTKKPVVRPEAGEKHIEKGHAVGSGGNPGGGGDPIARITKRGVLGLIAEKVQGQPIAGANIFGEGGFAKQIDAIISGTNGLIRGGTGGVGRRGEQGIGYGIGENSGLGGNTWTGVDDIMGSLLPTADDIQLAKPEHKPSTLMADRAAYVPGSGILTGGRSRASIMRVVMQNIAALRYAYNKRLREKPGLKGKVTCKFAIDESGKIIFCEMVESTVLDPQLEADVVARVRSWVFEKIDKPGDVTEVVYPFAFSQ
jgi:TonB family protein